MIFLLFMTSFILMISGGLLFTEQETNMTIAWLLLGSGVFLFIATIIYYMRKKNKDCALDCAIMDCDDLDCGDLDCSPDCSW